MFVHTQQPIPVEKQLFGAADAYLTRPMRAPERLNMQAMTRDGFRQKHPLDRTRTSGAKRGRKTLEAYKGIS
ncbi:MAG: hypothetical protein DIU63_15845 [Proteobacteria bacterium]|nr:MAG: hypothetical protein DIU63_15845 [Pseudomonadota bacterium]